MPTPRLVRRRAPWLVALAVLFARAPRVSAGEEVLRDEWQVSTIDGARSGYEHQVVRRLEDGRIETSVESKLVIKRMNRTIEMASRKTTVETAIGKLVSIVDVSKQSAEETTTRIAFGEGTAKVTTQTMGTSRDVVTPMPGDLIGPWRADRIPAEAGYPDGKTFDLRLFDQSMGGAVGTHTRVAAREDVEVAPGRTEKAIRLESTIDGVPVQVTSWVSPEGTTLKTKVSIAGLRIEARRATKEEALAPTDAAAPQTDVFAKTLILSKVLVPHARSLESALVRIRPRKPDAVLPDLTTERQTLERKEPDGGVVLRIRRLVPPDGAGTRPLAAPPAELAPFLAPSSALQSDDPLIVKAAQDAIAREKDAWKAAQAIERWVEKNLTNKNMGVGFASALEVCKNREGDCTEHAVLVAALCRAAGIPSRVVLGLEYLMGIWGGHAWSEVWIAGHWYALDGTLGLGSVDPLHLSLAATALEEGTFGKDQLAIASVVGSVDVDVLEAEWNGRVLPVADPAAVKVEGTRYVNRLHDVAFSVPEGFAVLPVVPEGLEDRLARASGKNAKGVYEIVLRVRDVDGEPPHRPPAAPEIQVDGRTGYTAPRKEGGHEAFVVASGVVYRFTVTPGDDGGKKVLQSVLDTVDLDPVPPK